MLRVKSNLQKKLMNNFWQKKFYCINHKRKQRYGFKSFNNSSKIKNEIITENENTIYFIKMQSTFISFRNFQLLFKPINCVTFCRESITHQTD